MAYIAKTDPKFRGIFSSEMTYENYYSFMEKVYQYVKPVEIYRAENKENTRSIFGLEIPPSIGISNENRLIEGVCNYADSLNISISHVKSHRVQSKIHLLEYIKEGISKDRPVGLLNMFSCAKMDYLSPKANAYKRVDCKLHWVTVVGVRADSYSSDTYLDVLTWGGRATINYNELWNLNKTSFIFPPRGVCFQ